MPHPDDTPRISPHTNFAEGRRIDGAFAVALSRPHAHPHAKTQGKAPYRR